MSTTLLRRPLALGLVAGSTALAACGIRTQQEIEMGQQYAAEINRQLPIVDDPVVHRYINDLGNRIQRQPGTRDIPYTYYVVNINEVNAFAVPGGFVYINRGIIERAENLSELAGVVAHEIGHVEARHSVAMLERMQAAQVGVGVASILLGGPPGGLAGAAVDIGAGLYFARHSREAEHEADAIAVQLLPGAGIDPNGLVTFFRKLLEEQQRTPTHRGAVVRHAPAHGGADRHHPGPDPGPATERLANLQVNSADYNSFRARVPSCRQPPPEFRR
jgi:beta-barrel assembly-enhancing protease